MHQFILLTQGPIPDFSRKNIGRNWKSQNSQQAFDVWNAQKLRQITTSKSNFANPNKLQNSLTAEAEMHENLDDKTCQTTMGKC